MPLKQPTRAIQGETPLPDPKPFDTGQARRPYSVLLRVGFAMPLRLPAARCALTAPFHPYLTSEAVCSLWHFPWASQQAARPAGVTRHPCFVEPGLSSRFLRTPQLPGPLADLRLEVLVGENNSTVLKPMQPEHMY